MEIKPHDLRLGNLVEVEGETASITAIGKISVYFNRTSGRRGSEHLTSVSPIELTPEWLKLVDWGGYNYLYFNSYFCLDEQGHLYYHGDYTGINVNYVHTLQNLFYALTGEELAIDKHISNGN